MAPVSPISSASTGSVVPGGRPSSIFQPDAGTGWAGQRQVGLSNSSGATGPAFGFNPLGQKAGGAWGMQPAQPRKLTLKPVSSGTRSSNDKSHSSLANIQQEQELEQKQYRAQHRSGGDGFRINTSSSLPSGSTGLPPQASLSPIRSGPDMTLSSEAASGSHYQLSIAAVVQRSAPRKIPGSRGAGYGQAPSTGGTAATVSDGAPSRNAWASTPGSSLASCRSYEGQAGSFREIQKAEENERMALESASPHRSGGWMMLPGDYRKSAKDIRVIEEEELANKQKSTSHQR
jgi:hypothetical protein